MKLLAAALLLAPCISVHAEQIGPLRLEGVSLAKALATYAELSGSELTPANAATNSTAQVNLILPRRTEKADALRFFRTVLLRQAGVTINAVDAKHASVSMSESLEGKSQPLSSAPPPRTDYDPSPIERAFGGIGAILGVDQATKQFLIRGSLPGSPTDLANIPQGMIIRSVDGISTEGENLRELVERVRGPIGSSIELELLDPAGGAAQTVKLKREVIRPANSPGVQRLPVEPTPRKEGLILLQTNDVLRVALPEGGWAVLQFLSFKPAQKSAAAPLLEAEYRWKFKSWRGGQLEGGTNQVAGVFSDPVGGISASKTRAEVPIKVGAFFFGWSQEAKDQAYLHVDLAAGKFDFIARFEDES